ncbi:DnaA N-terminal domain-containing protein [Sporosarcina newyorkensis]|uniref:DnaA N-terminal domain-containing protein n=1 Tax=Sporosarcina TaxID=1569 RepID=UPI003D039CDF
MNIKIIAPNSFVSDWIATHYADLIKEISAESLSFNSAIGTVEVITASDYIKN